MIQLDSISPVAFYLTGGFMAYATASMVAYTLWVLYAMRLRRLGYVVVDKHMVAAQLRADLVGALGRLLPESLRPVPASKDAELLNRHLGGA